MGASGKSRGAKSLNTASNLANLLPTGTVLTFVALEPSFTNNGQCLPANKYLTFGIIVICSVACFLSSFTDSFKASNGKVYYGIATVKGLYIFNKDDSDEDYDSDHNDEEDKEKGDANKVKEKGDAKPHEPKDVNNYKICPRDFVHAFCSLIVFLVFAISSSDVQRCFFPHSGANGNQLMMNLPLGVGALATFLFMIFPTKRRGIGYGKSSKPRTSRSATI